MVIQLTGKKTFTLVAAEHSHLLAPQISQEGRAYFFSTLPADLDAIKNIPRYSVELEAGDVLWVPAWTWYVLFAPCRLLHGCI